MDLNRLQKLAGLPLTEAVQVNEASKTNTVEVHSSHAGNGQMGDIIVIDGSAAIGDLAKMLGIPDGWKKVQLKNGVYAAFNSGDRLTFFSNERDFQADDEDEQDED